MATQGSRDGKRVAVYWDLDAAVKELRKIADPLIQIGQGLEALGKAVKSLRLASERAQPTRHEWSDDKGPHVKVSRDGLPRSITTRAAKLATQVEVLAQEVKALPITPEQKAQARVERAKRREAAKATPKVNRKGGKK